MRSVERLRNSEFNQKEVNRAKNSAYRYLALRPRARSEVERKLGEKGFSEDIIATVLAGLDRLGYVNDREFSRQWANSRVRLRGFGRRRIEQELREKGVSREIISETLEDLCQLSAEVDLARNEAEKKMKTLTRFDPEVRRRRLAAFLQRKGFSSEIIHSILRLNL